MKTALLERRARRRRLKIAILRDVRKGYYGSEAAGRHGVSLGTFFQWQWTDAAFNTALKDAVKNVFTASRWPSWPSCVMAGC